MVQHPDLTAISKSNEKNKAKEKELLMAALKARQNGITNAHCIGKNQNQTLITFDRETLPLNVIPESYINEGKKSVCHGNEEKTRPLYVVPTPRPYSRFMPDKGSKLPVLWS